MNIETRLSRLYSPIHDCFAAIDAARVAATITGEPHILYLDRTTGRLRWYVRSVVDRSPDHWEWVGGIYEPGEARSNIGCNPELTPELAEERGVSPHIDLDTLAAEYRRASNLVTIYPSAYSDAMTVTRAEAAAYIRRMRARGFRFRPKHRPGAKRRTWRAVGLFDWVTVIWEIRPAKEHT